VPIQVAGLPILFPQESGSLAMFTAAATSHSSAIRRCRLRRGSPRTLRTLIRPLPFAAIDDAGAAAFRAWPDVKSVSNVAATAIVTDHAWPQNLDEAYHDEGTPPQRPAPRRAHVSP
jgi:hypothetical protein